MTIRFAEKSEAKSISRFVSELAVKHIGSSLKVGGLENLLPKGGPSGVEQGRSLWTVALRAVVWHCVGDRYNSVTTADRHEYEPTT